MRLLFKRCHGENPPSCGAAAEWAELCEFVELESFIYQSGKTRPLPTDERELLSFITHIAHRPRQLACQCADTGQSLFDESFFCLEQNNVRAGSPATPLPA